MKRRYIIDSLDTMEEAVRYFKMLPFFENNIKGFSIAEMTPPGLLFGGNDGYEGCWEWKGPVIQMQTAAYGKFFRRKAGFVDIELVPDFLNYRRWAYPVEEGSTGQLLLEIIRENEGITSTELRKILNNELILSDAVNSLPKENKIKRSSIESPLQKLQMGGHILIADFQYKLTNRGDRYGWGVALYSTPEIWFERLPEVKCTPEESLERLIKALMKSLPGVSEEKIKKLII